MRPDPQLEKKLQTAITSEIKLQEPIGMRSAYKLTSKGLP